MAYSTALFVIMFILLCGNGIYGQDDESSPATSATSVEGPTAESKASESDQTSSEEATVPVTATTAGETTGMAEATEAAAEAAAPAAGETQPTVEVATIAVMDTTGHAKVTPADGTSIGNMPQMSYTMQLIVQLLANYIIFGL
ncbi:hypothetical protein X798_00114 [Onchocerca flexuosa]|uniref:Uncharacterized protein n=1 Tax=Onchocerca flexuosa TaxID=387005 RepID=A0A238C4U4_9BILA|nr:hypothetical protein X798_00114 [Onchocerca flexuosa]